MTEDFLARLATGGFAGLEGPAATPSAFFGELDLSFGRANRENQVHRQGRIALVLNHDAAPFTWSADERFRE